MPKTELVDLTLHIHYETDGDGTEANEGSYLVSDDGDRRKAVWVPKKHCEVTRKGKSPVAEITMPVWLAGKKGLI